MQSADCRGDDVRREKGLRAEGLPDWQGGVPGRGDRIPGNRARAGWL